jgi:hypothetical protein
MVLTKDVPAGPGGSTMVASHMVRFSLLLRLVVSIALLLAMAPVVAQGVVAFGGGGEWAGPITSVISLAQRSWWLPTLLFVGGLTIGVWADWMVRRVDHARRASRKGLGARLVRLAEEIARRELVSRPTSPEWPRNLGGARRAVRIALARLERFGIWNPGPAAFQVPRGGEFLIDFFREIGMLLENERFEDAKFRADAAKLRFQLIGNHM